ncbi:uncharacterized protein LOC131852187 [Achroia grisella]|uniref:uncharacterized protein LOC131852187 n=1 Tax=Achroia grisella TaxID=688607 RepID=UPI0027D20791|nr:uncharacterized protein LOC131852187 [Achroia grisella]
MTSLVPVKSSKSELLAIYRLEFYKKKKNWKLCTEEKEKRKRVVAIESAKILNQTYELECGGNKDISSSDRHAVLETITSNDTLPSNVPNQHISTIDSDIGTYTYTVDMKASKFDQVRTEIEKNRKMRNWSKSEKLTAWSEIDCKDTNEDEMRRDGDWVETIWAEECNGAEVKELVGVEDHVWSENEELWTEYGTQSCPREVPHEEQFLQDDRCRPCSDQPLPFPSHDAWPVEEELREAMETLLEAESSVAQVDLQHILHYDGCHLVDDYVEFLSGAHAAPHSSETDLRFDAVRDPPAGAWHLTGDQLRHRVASLAAVLRELLQQLKDRDLEHQLLPSDLKQPCNMTADECPTRDVGPSEPTYTTHKSPKRELTYSMQDDFLAGSFLQAPEGFLEDSNRFLQNREDLPALQLPEEYVGCRQEADMKSAKFYNTVSYGGEGRFLQVGNDMSELEGTGRGRGRMHTPTIGIRNGRPYRLNNGF